MRAASYSAISSLCARLPSVARSDAHLPSTLFEALATEELGARSNLQVRPPRR